MQKKSVKRVKKAAAVKKKVNKPKPLKPAKLVKPVKPVKPKPTGQLAGEVTHYFSKIQVVVIKVKIPLKVGETIRIEGRGLSFIQKINSLQIESVSVSSAKKGDVIGMKVNKPAKEGDKVFKLK